MLFKLLRLEEEDEEIDELKTLSQACAHVAQAMGHDRDSVTLAVMEFHRDGRARHLAVRARLQQGGPLVDPDAQELIPC